jgi:hypothetical protein
MDGPVVGAAAGAQGAQPESFSAQISISFKFPHDEIELQKTQIAERY